MSINALIVDDEPPARRRLRTMLSAEPDIAVVGEAGTVGEAATLLRSLSRVDVIFLDIQMPGRDGFDLVDDLAWGVADHDPAVVFVTAHGEHAVRAFRVRATDYLLKPFDRLRLAEALERVREAVAARLVPLPRLAVETGTRIRLVDLGQIDYLRADGNYVRVHTPAGSYLVRETLTAVTARLPADQFCRIHRSLVVRLDRVREVEVLDHGELALRLADGARLISGRSYRDRVRAALGLRR